MVVLGDPPGLGVLCVITAFCHITVISAHIHPPADTHHSPLNGSMAPYDEAGGDGTALSPLNPLEYQVERPLRHDDKGVGSTQGTIYEMTPRVSETNGGNYVKPQAVAENNEAKTKTAKPGMSKIETKTKSKPHSGESKEKLASTLSSATRSTATTLTSARRTKTSSRAAPAWMSGSFGDQRDQEDLIQERSEQNTKQPQELVISSGSMGSASNELSSDYNNRISDLFLKNDNSSINPEYLYNTRTMKQYFKDDNKRIVHNDLLNRDKTNINGIATRKSFKAVNVIQDEKYLNRNVFNKFTKMSMSKKSKRSTGDFYDSESSENFKFTRTLLNPSLDPKERQEISPGYSFAASRSIHASDMKDVTTFTGEGDQSETVDEGPNQPEDADYVSHSDQAPPDLGILPSGFAPRPNEVEGCRCWHTHDGGGKAEVECRCQGDHIHHLTQHNISRHVNRLTLTKVGLERLRRQDLANYSQTLQEIILQDAKQLEEIDSGTFANLPYLQTIYILHTPQLKHLHPDLFQVFLPSLKILRIVNAGLVEVPALSYLHTKHILHMVDLENNQIRLIKSGSITVSVQQLLLNYNALEYVDQWAFNGSQIELLSMKGNKQLTALHDLAFAGLKSLVSLDLSETSITHLPTRGIEGLEELRLTGTYSLKVFPSVLTFKSIRKAELTYHYHCCAFRFPKIHDPNKYKEYMEFTKRMENHDCSEMITDAPAAPMWGKRRRRSTYPQKLPDHSKLTNLYRLQKNKVISNLKSKRDVENKSDTNMESNYHYYHKTGPPSSSQNSTIKGSEGFGFKDYADLHSDFHGRTQAGFEDGFMGPDQGIHGESGGLYDDRAFGQSIFGSSGPYVEFDSYNDIPDGTFGEVDIGFGGSGVLFDHLEGDFGPIGPKSEDGTEVDHGIGNHNGYWQTAIPPSHGEISVNITCGKLSKNYGLVQCIPEPDAFNPCEDIMGNIGLRIAVWVVVFLAVLGNLSVMVVLMSTRFKMSVSKFLMCNLAIADLCMGLYLLMIAAMDLHTIGEYFNYAIDWQNGPGCKVAGFLTVFASELSILTLTVITLERWYTITYAIHLNKRLRLKAASRVMVLAWTYSITMATLPLMGVSGYSKTSICLPMETHDVADIAYLLILLITNGLAFILICVCYAKMYCSIAGNNLAANTSDTTVAKRMALLVFTDFACWAPIAFFGLTAVSGYPLISVTHAKFLLVFFYPLNSCANPYLYAILTKQYRRDLFILLARYGFCTKRAVKYKGAYSSNNTLMNHNIVMGSAKGPGSGGGASRRISTLTQVTCVNEPRNKLKASSMESLDVPRLRSISAELAVPGSEITARMVDRRVSDVGRRLKPVAETHSPQGAAGSPHPIKNCQARMSFTPEQEALLLKYASDRNISSNIPKVRHKSESGLDDIAAYAEVCATDKLIAHTSDAAVTLVSSHPEEGLTLCTYTPTRSNIVNTPTSQSQDIGLPLQTYTNSTTNMVSTSITPPLDEGLPLHTYTATTSNTDTAPPSPHQQPSGQRESVT